MSNAAIELKNVSVTLGKDFRALLNVSAQIPTGRIVGFIGPSGAGKTTLIRCIVGRQRLGGGSITVLGTPAGSASLRHDVCYMTQELSIYSDLTVAENLRYFGVMVGVPKRELDSQVKLVLAAVGMAKHANDLVEHLSGGEQRRVSLAVALIGSPKLMVLDEPTVGLDPVLREALWGLFRRLVKQGTTIILSSHVMDEAERCDELLLIRDGEVLAAGTPEQLCKQTQSRTIEQTFIKLVEEQS